MVRMERAGASAWRLPHGFSCVDWRCTCVHHAAHSMQHSIRPHHAFRPQSGCAAKGDRPLALPRPAAAPASDEEWVNPRPCLPAAPKPAPALAVRPPAAPLAPHRPALRPYVCMTNGAAHVRLVALAGSARTFRRSGSANGSGRGGA